MQKSIENVEQIILIRFSAFKALQKYDRQNILHIAMKAEHLQ